MALSNIRPITQMALPTPVPIANAVTINTTSAMAQIVPSTFETHYATLNYWARDAIISDLDDSLTISVPDNPVGTVVNIPVPTASGLTPISTPGTASDASSDPPLGGDLDKITDQICKKECAPGSGQEVNVWDNYSTIHNGTHIATNHTLIFCDGEGCVAHVRTMTTVFDTDDDYAEPTTSLFTAVASGATTTTTPAATSVPSSV